MDELLGGVVGRRVGRCLIGDCMVNGCPPGGVGWLGSGLGSSSEATGITCEPSLDIHRGHSRAPNQFGWPSTVATDRGVKKSFDTAVCRDAGPVARCGPLPVSRVVWTLDRPPCSSTDAGSANPSWACASLLAAGTAGSIISGTPPLSPDSVARLALPTSPGNC